MKKIIAKFVLMMMLTIIIIELGYIVHAIYQKNIIEVSESGTIYRDKGNYIEGQYTDGEKFYIGKGN